MFKLDKLGRLDRLASELVHCSESTGGLLEYLMVVFGVSFNNELVAFVYAIGLFMIPYSHKNLLLIGLVPSLGLLASYLLKHKISRPRPGLFTPRAAALIYDLRGREKNHSMPSGDSLQAAIFWSIMFNFQVVSCPTAVLCAGLTMTARVYYMCHYPTDTLFGALIGISIFYTVNYFVDKL